MMDCEKYFIIGDIHGCYRELLELLSKINPDPVADTLIFLGDYIDRGPDSKNVVSEILKLKKEFLTKYCIDRQKLTNSTVAV